MGAGSSRRAGGVQQPLLGDADAAPSAPPPPPAALPPAMQYAVVGGGGCGGGNNLSVSPPLHYPNLPGALEPPAPPAYCTGYPADNGAATPPPGAGAGGDGAGAVFFPPPPIVVETHSHTHVHHQPPPAVQLPPCCPGCGQPGGGRSRRESGLCAWGAALALCFTCPCCFFLPFCTSCARDRVYRCARCGCELGRSRPCF